MRRAILQVLTLVLAPTVIAAQSAGTPINLVAVLDGVGAAVERYFARAQSLICLESVTQQPIRQDMLSDGSLARRLTYDLRVAWEPSVDGQTPEATIQRELLKVGNRAPRPKDKPGCMDPTEVSPEPLSFLLPSKQGEWIFTVAGSAKVKGRAAVMLDYRPREVGPITLRERTPPEDCFFIDMPGGVRGRVWIDADTNDVLRIDERLTGIHELTLPGTRNRRDELRLSFERLDTSTLYRPVTFTDPDEIVMLPVSVETVQISRPCAPCLRTTTVFSNYRRFITGGRIVQND